MFLGIAFVVGVVLVLTNQNNSRLFSIPKNKNGIDSVSPTPPNQHATVVSKSLFVPYWTMGKSVLQIDGFDKLIYFGITADTNGINKQDQGYARLATFQRLSKNTSQPILAVRMTDSSINSKILQDKKAQEKIAAESVSIAKENGFTQVLLDFELAALSFPSVIQGINDFVETFRKQVQQENLTFSLALYGDTFYRARPYDVKTITKNADGVYILAYDFHKARENPGPNFPLNGKETYGYDFKTMIEDFSKVVAKEKLVVVFGFYGYNWVTDGKEQAIENGYAQTTQEILSRFISGCTYENCVVKADAVSAETKITYIDEKHLRHTIWFEDQQSVAKKEAYLQEIGIRNVSFWAYSYF